MIYYVKDKHSSPVAQFPSDEKEIIIMQNVSSVVRNSLCSGCTICEEICPKNAIKIIKFEDGYFRPEVSEECVECGGCLEICSGIDQTYIVGKGEKEDKLFGRYTGIYRGWAKDEKIRKMGSSGGIARSLALDLFKNRKIDGVISLVDNPSNPLGPLVKLLKNEDAILKISKSKYLAVDFSDSIKILKQEEGVYLVIGLPCQIASIKKSQHHLKSKLILIDLLCGRVCSQNLTELYLKKNNMNSLIHIDYRAKTFGWDKYSIKLTSKNNESDKISNKSEFGLLMNSKLFTQQRCLKCTLGFSGVSDITLGDYWDKKYRNENLGVSLIQSRSLLGKEIIENSGCIEKHEEDINSMYKTQPWFKLSFNRIFDNYKRGELEEKFPDTNIFKGIERKPSFYFMLKRKIDIESLYYKKRINKKVMDMFLRGENIDKILKFYQREKRTNHILSLPFRINSYALRKIKKLYVKL